MLLDLGLPDTDGLDLVRALLTVYPGLPVVMLTARAEEADVVAGLRAGAVDYVTKPFRLAELLARVHAHLRTIRHRDSDARMLSIGDLRVDLGARRVWWVAPRWCCARGSSTCSPRWPSARAKS